MTQIAPSDVEICCRICHVVGVVEVNRRERALCFQKTLESFNAHPFRPNLPHGCYAPMVSAGLRAATGAKVIKTRSVVPGCDRAAPGWPDRCGAGCRRGPRARCR